MQIIMDNDFSHDTHGRRTVRLLLLSENIEASAPEIGLPDDLKNWGMDAYDNWMNALSKAGIEKGEQDMAFESYHALFADAREYYLNTKELLWALIADTEDGREIAEKYGIIGRTPEKLGDFLGVVKLFKDASDDLRAIGDPRVLAEVIVDNVVAKSQDAAEAYQTAQNERKESSAAFDELSALYEEDAQKLGLVYNYAKLGWGKYSPNLIILGFAPSVVRPGGGQPDAPENFVCALPTKTFEWDAVDGATSYQLVYSADMDVWDEVYSGEDTSFVFDPGAGIWYFRVRARDVDGYGDWSGVISVNFSGGALAAPKNLAFDVNNKKLSWSLVPTADKYEVEVNDKSSQLVFSGETANDNIKIENLSEQVEYTAKVRAVKDGSPQEYSPWSDGIAVWLGLPFVPQNLRWHPAEYHGDTFALIEWDAALGADTYELEFDPAGGDAEIFDVGANLYKYEDIMHTPRTYKYRVRGKNSYGLSDWSVTLTIEIA